MSGRDGVSIFCTSNSSLSGVGMITGLDGNIFPFAPDGGVLTDAWRVNNPWKRPGIIHISTASVSAADQGIYTCTIPDSNNKLFIFNFGVYPSGFMGEMYIAT